MRKIFLSAGLAAAIAAGVVWAVVPQKWTFRTYDDFLRGKFDGVSLSTEGLLSLAPKEEPMEGPTEEFYLSYVTTVDGTAFVGTGHGGRVFKRAKGLPGELYFQTSEMDVTALALDAKGVLYAGTAPHGKVYKITEKGKGTEFFNPAEKYIWDLRFEGTGNLLAAVGENGGIYEISPQGQGRLLFKSEENHILCILRDRNGNLIAGSGGGGSVYRISPGGKGQVLFETPFEEVRAVAVDAQGNILAAAGGTVKAKKEDPTPTSRSGAGEVTVAVSAASAGGQTGAASLPPGLAKSAGPAGPSAGEPGALFRISPDGSTKKLWSAPDELPYALSWNEAEKKILIGTGPKGRLYALDKDDRLSLVLQKNSEQIFLLEPVGSALHLVANNPPQITAVFAEGRAAGEFLSPVLDARLPAAWGRIGWESTATPEALVQLLTRSGNTSEPNSSWSDWSPPYQKTGGEPVLSPKGRYTQFRVLFKAGTARTSPVVSKISLNYLQANEAPVISGLDLLASNEVYLKPIDQDEIIWGLERRTFEPPTGRKDDMKFAMARRVERMGFQTIVWDAGDENGDSLSYAVWIKADGDSKWRLLEDRWMESLFTFSSTGLADGVYTLKVVASDLPSNPPDQEKKSERTSPAFIIDNGPPVVKAVQTQRTAEMLLLSFTVEDAFSAIKEVRYLMRPDDWRLAFPEDGICDGKTETFKLKIPLAAGADNILTIQVKDTTGNTASFKQIY